MEAYEEDIASEQHEQQEWSEDDIMLLFMCCDTDCDSVVLVQDLINILERLNSQHGMIVDTIQALKSRKGEEITSEVFLKVIRGKIFSFANVETKIRTFEEHYEKLIAEYEDEILNIKDEHAKTLKSTISKYVNKTFELSELLETTKHERNLALDECKKLKVELRETKKMKNSYKEEVENLMEEIKNRDEECRHALQVVSEVKCSLTNYQIERKRANVSFQNAKAEIYLLTSQVEKLSKELEEERKKESHFENMFNQLNENMEDLERQKSESLVYAEQKKIEIVELKQKISVLDSELEEERGKSLKERSEKRKGEEEFQKNVEIIKQLENEIEFTKAESIKALNHSIKIIQQVESERKVQNVQSNAVIDELESQVAFLKEKTEQSIQCCKETFQLIDTIEAERKQVVAHYQKSETEVARLKIEIEKLKFESEGEKNTSKIVEDLQKDLGLLKGKTEVAVQSFNESLVAFKKAESERAQLEAEIKHDKSRLSEITELELLTTDIQNLELDRTLCDIAMEEKDEMVERLMNELNDMHDIEEKRRKKDQAENRLIEEIKFLKSRTKVASPKESAREEDTHIFREISSPQQSPKELSYYLSPYANELDLPAFFPMSPNE